MSNINFWSKLPFKLNKKKKLGKKDEKKEMLELHTRALDQICTLHKANEALYFLSIFAEKPDSIKQITSTKQIPRIRWVDNIQNSSLKTPSRWDEYLSPTLIISYNSVTPFTYDALCKYKGNGILFVYFLLNL